MNNSIVIEAVLDKIDAELKRLYWNKKQEEWSSPFDNTGEEYSNDVFTVRAYNWDGNYDCNFEYKDFKAWWYKHSNRGLEWTYKNERNVLPPSEFLQEMIDDCVTSVSIDWDVI